MKKLFIIDLMPFLYRGHFVFLKSPRMTSTGINTSAKGSSLITFMIFICSWKGRAVACIQYTGWWSAI